MSNTPHELHEEFPAEAAKIHALKVSNAHFARLAEEYHELNRQVHRAESGVEPVDQFAEIVQAADIVLGSAEKSLLDSLPSPT